MCIFCKIVATEIPSKKIYEDESVLGMLDISQTTKGHSLVLPKKHYDNILEMPKEELDHMINVVQDLSKQLINKLDAKGINVLTNINEAAGQSVLHAHIHLIPRYNENDTVKIQYTQNEFDLDEIQKTINQ